MRGFPTSIFQGTPSLDIKNDLIGEWTAPELNMVWSFEHDHLTVTDEHGDKKSQFHYHCFTKHDVKLLDINPIADENDLFIKSVLSPPHHTLFMIDVDNNELTLYTLDNDTLEKCFIEKHINGYNVTQDEYMICHLSTESWDNFWMTQTI